MPKKYKFNITEKEETKSTEEEQDDMPELTDRYSTIKKFVAVHSPLRENVTDDATLGVLDQTEKEYIYNMLDNVIIIHSHWEKYFDALDRCKLNNKEKYEAKKRIMRDRDYVTRLLMSKVYALPVYNRNKITNYLIRWGLQPERVLEPEEEEARNEPKNEKLLTKLKKRLGMKANDQEETT